MNKIYSVIIMLCITTLTHGAAAETDKPEAPKGARNSHDKTLHNLNMHASLPSLAHRAAAARLLLINSPKKEPVPNTAYVQPVDQKETTDPFTIDHDGHPGDHTLHNSHRSIEHDGSIYG